MENQDDKGEGLFEILILFELLSHKIGIKDGVGGGWKKVKLLRETAQIVSL